MPDRLVMRMVFALFGGAACVLLQGCLILPGSEPISTPVIGTVFDVATSQPVTGARVSAVRAQYHESTITDQQGRYKLSSLRQWFWLVYAGDPGVFPSPIYISNHDAPPIVTVYATGYEPAERTFGTAKLVYSKPPGPDEERVNFEVRRQGEAASVGSPSRQHNSP